MRTLTAATRDEFAAWLNAALRPLIGELRGERLFINDAWMVSLRAHGGLLHDAWVKSGQVRLLWTRECAVAEMLRHARMQAGWEFVRSATTAWRVMHSVKGAEMPINIRAALTVVLGDKPTARYALDATRLEAILAASTRRGIRAGMEVLNATGTDMARTHRQLRELTGFDPLPDENADVTLAWLARFGIDVPGISSEAWGERVVADSMHAAEAEAVYEKALYLRRRYAKVRELSAAVKRGKLHSTLQPFAQVSGRISSTGPALNNVAEDLRHLLVARPGHVLVTADFDGIEPRVLAGLSGDKGLAHHLATGDPYADAAARAGYDRVEYRKPFKVTMLASMYGSGPGRTARQLGVSVDEAKRIREELWAPYPTAQAWLSENNGSGALRLDSGRPLGVVERGYARPNLVIQSTAYDLFQSAALRVYDALPTGAHIWLTMHDELIIEAPERLADDVSNALATHMRTECHGVPIGAAPVVLGAHWRKV